MAEPKVLYHAKIAGNNRGFMGKKSLYKGLESELGLTEGEPEDGYASTGKSDSRMFATIDCIVEVQAATETTLAIRKTTRLNCDPAKVATATLALKGKNIQVGSGRGDIVRATAR